MVRWQCDLRASALAQRLTAGIFLAVANIMIFLLPWGASFLLVKALLLGAAGYEWRNNARRIRLRSGTLIWQQSGDWHWQRQKWQLQSPACCLDFAVLLCFSKGSGRQQKLWLMRDSMEEAQWRALRYQLLSTANVDIASERR